MTKKPKDEPIDAELVDNEKAIEKVETNQVQTLVPMPSMNIEALMEKALMQNASIETVERLVALSERMQAQWAKQQFNRALAKFQKECGPIVKTKPVFKKGATPAEKKAFYEKGDPSGVQYVYAALEDVLAQATPVLYANGFSFTMKAEVYTKDMELKAICLLHHADGHTEPTDFTVPIGSDYMSKQQQFGAAMQFAKRYAFLNATGLQPLGEDTDARGPDKREGGGGKDHLFKEPTAKSDKRKDAPEQHGDPSTAQKAYPSIKRANNDSDSVQKSSLSTLRSNMKRLKVSEESFASAFGFPLEQLDKHALNDVIDWMKEHADG